MTSHYRPLKNRLTLTMSHSFYVINPLYHRYSCDLLIRGGPVHFCNIFQITTRPENLEITRHEATKYKTYEFNEANRSFKLLYHKIEISDRVVTSMVL